MNRRKVKAIIYVPPDTAGSRQKVIVYILPRHCYADGIKVSKTVFTFSTHVNSVNRSRVRMNTPNLDVTEVDTKTSSKQAC